jgi:hypothetical protein
MSRRNECRVFFCKIFTGSDMPKVEGSPLLALEYVDLVYIFPLLRSFNIDLIAYVKWAQIGMCVCPYV